jgi:NADPH2:quinone reductase
VHRYGSPTEALELDEVDDPVPGPGELLVRTATTACNFNEVDGCFGRYRTVDPPVPYTLGMEVVGEVVAAADDAVGQSWVGRRVMATAVGAHGAHAELVLASVDMTFDVPDGLDDVDAAAFLFPFHVAHLALVERGHLQEGQWVLVHAGAGGVGSAAVQLASTLGGRVIATAGGPEKVELCRRLGAEIALDHRAGDLAPAILEATGGRGVDLVCDLVGGATTTATFPVVAHGGRHVLAGFSGGIEAEDEGIAPRPVLFGNFDLVGVMLAYVADPSVAKAWTGFNLFSRADGEAVQAHLVELLSAGRLRTVVGRTAPAEDLPVELERLAARRTTGRTVLDWR